jgi:hypothetical protein
MASTMDKNIQGRGNKTVFPTVMDRIGSKIYLTRKLTVLLSGRGKTRAYIYRFKLWEDMKGICNKDDQTMDHL